MKLPKYPEEFFDFSNGVNITNEKINEAIKELVDELEENKQIHGMSRSTGNTKISVIRDENECYEVEVYKNYQRKLIDPFK